MRVAATSYGQLPGRLQGDGATLSPRGLENRLMNRGTGAHRRRRRAGLQTYGHHILTRPFGKFLSAQRKSSNQSRMARLAALMSKLVGSNGPPHHRRIASCSGWDRSPMARRKSS